MSARRIADLRFDGGKMMYRLDPQDPGSGRTIQACAEALNDLRRQGLAAFLEPLGVTRQGQAYTPAKDADTLVRQCGIAAGLGDSSLHLWLKVPIVDGLERVCRATTLPLLLLGGPARGTPEETLRDFAGGLAAGSRVRGAIIGRNLLYPGHADPLPMCRALTALVHRGADLTTALKRLDEPTSRPRRRAAPGTPAAPATPATPAAPA
jgi:DhnA family fructose-bisphosphate aldolase class Ia